MKPSVGVCETRAKAFPEHCLEMYVLTFERYLEVHSFLGNLRYLRYREGAGIETGFPFDVTFFRNNKTHLSISFAVSFYAIDSDHIAILFFIPEFLHPYLTHRLDLFGWVARGGYEYHNSQRVIIGRICDV